MHLKHTVSFGVATAQVNRSMLDDISDEEEDEAEEEEEEEEEEEHAESAASATQLVGKMEGLKPAVDAMYVRQKRKRSPQGV